MSIQEALQNKIDLKTKPLGALGALEALALQIGTVQNSTQPSLNYPHIVVYAADHGIAKEGVSAYPQEVTYQMVMNFLNGGAAINIFSEQNNIALKIVDAGVNFDFKEEERLTHAKVGYETESFLRQKAMTHLQLQQCFDNAKIIIKEIADRGCNIIGFGEMGIGNTSSASMIMSSICNLPLDKCIGRGTGLSNEQLDKKARILKSAQSFHGNLTDPLQILQTYGGFEVAHIVASMLEAYQHNMLIMVDGFIASAAFLIAKSQAPEIQKNAIFCHQSDESGHQLLLQHLNATPLISLNLRVGEGTGCAIAYPIIESAVAFLNNMASFDSAEVSNKNEERN